jgi:hypothetical protein
LICRDSAFLLKKCRLSGFDAYLLIAVACFVDSLDFGIEEKTNTVYVDRFFWRPVRFAATLYNNNITRLWV